MYFTARVPAAQGRGAQRETRLGAWASPHQQAIPHATRPALFRAASQKAKPIYPLIRPNNNSASASYTRPPRWGSLRLLLVATRRFVTAHAGRSRVAGCQMTAARPGWGGGRHARARPLAGWTRAAKRAGRPYDTNAGVCSLDFFCFACAVLVHYSTCPDRDLSAIVRGRKRRANRRRPCPGGW